MHGRQFAIRGNTPGGTKPLPRSGAEVKRRGVDAGATGRRCAARLSMNLCWADRCAPDVQSGTGGATVLPCPESQQVSPVDEDVYAELMEPRAAVWSERAARAVGETRVRYALARAAAARRKYSRKLAKCERRGQRVKCGCRGWRGVHLYACRQHLVCTTCQRARARRLGARIRAGLEGAVSGAPYGHRLVLLTLTLRHSGDIAEDRAALARGWRAFYKALYRRGWGKFQYVGTWEVTPGEDGLGHIHAHVAVLWPWRDWSVCRELWLDACPESERITFVGARRDGLQSSPKSVANYLAKYISKGVDGAEFTRELRARVVAGTYNTRWVFTSRRFWILFEPRCQRCSCRIISAQYRWHGEAWKPVGDGLGAPRGSPQLSLEIPDPNERYRGCGS